MRVIEAIGRLTHFVLHPVILLAIHNSRRAYVILESEGKVLVVKNIIGSGQWHLPGGGCHASESYVHGAIRELNEEVGIEAREDQLVQVNGGPWRSTKGYDYELFKLTIEHSVTLNIDRKEILTAEWVRPEDLNEVNASETTLRAVRG